MSISAGIRPSTVSATSVDTAFERPSGAGIVDNVLNLLLSVPSGDD
jgi:hypothetical protein